MREPSNLVAGLLFTVPHPFIREEVSLPPDDPEAKGLHLVMSWRPGVRSEACAPDDFEFVADGMGAQILTVVSEHKPGRYPARIFYTRQWRSPAGKLFGKPALRIKTRQAFLRLVKGYRHDYRLMNQSGGSMIDSLHPTLSPGLSTSAAPHRMPETREELDAIVSLEWGKGYEARGSGTHWLTIDTAPTDRSFWGWHEEWFEPEICRWNGRSFRPDWVSERLEQTGNSGWYQPPSHWQDRTDVPRAPALSPSQPAEETKP